jgi:hypothetical protein
MKKLPFALGLTLATAFAVPALAMDPAPTAEHWTVGALLGDGFHDGVNFGLGLRGGYTLPQNIYIGGTFVYHFGSSESVLGRDYTVNVFYLGPEGGYDIPAGPVVVRPYLGLGPAFAHVSTPGGSNSDTRFGAWPGVTVMYPIQNFFIGADARVLIVSDFTAFGLFLNGGMQF